MLTEIPIEAIAPSKNPIRQTRDESKIKELAQSIAEKGVLQPIKVRPIKDDIIPCRKHYFEVLENTDLGGLDECLECGNLLSKTFNQDYYDNTGEYKFLPSFEIVFGTRRIEASRMIELNTIPSIIQDMSDSEAKIQGLTENLQREDMEPLEIAKGLQVLKKLTGWSNHEIERQGIMKDGSIRDHLALLYQPEDIQQLVVKSPDGRVEEGKITPTHIRVARFSGLDNEEVAHVVRKAANEGLTTKQTELVAKSYEAAPTLEAREKLLEWEFNSNLHDPEMIKDRAERLGTHDPLYQDEKPSAQESWDKAPEIKAIVDGLIQAVKVFTQLTKGLKKTAKAEGKFSFEASQFIVAKLEKFRDEINDTIELLKGDE